MPLLVDTIEIKSKMFDFSSSGRGRIDDMSLWVNGKELLNAIDLLDFSGGRFQTQLCSCCGIDGCEPGSWAMLRSFGEFIILIPAIEAMLEGSWEKIEYSPPYFLQKYGVPAFTNKQYEDLSKNYSTFPSPQFIPVVSNLELLAIIQMEAPGRMLGRLAESVKLDLDFIIAVEEGVLSVERERFAKLLQSVNLQEEAFCASEEFSKVKFILDLPGFPVWSPMAYMDGKPFLFAENRRMETP